MYNLLKLNLARNSLKYVIRTYEIKEMYIPYYLCNVIRKSLLAEQCKPIFYHIDDNFFPVDEFHENSFILYPNYFGICEHNVDLLVKKYPNLIVDNAHSFYSLPKGLATFNSARKFLDVPNGSYLWIKKFSCAMPSENEPFYMPINNVEKEKNEILFSDEDIKILHAKTVDKIEKFDNSSNRMKNFLKFHKIYSSVNTLNINLNEVSLPFCYPILVDDAQMANELVDKLTKKGLTIYRYWEKLPNNFPEYKFYERLVPIPLN